MESYTVYIDSVFWICEPNLVSCSMLYRYVIENGHFITDDPSQADFIIINSCGFNKENEDRSINFFQKYYNQKKKHARIIMFGCLVNINETRLKSLDVILVGQKDTSSLDRIFYRTTHFASIQPYCDDVTKKMLQVGKQLNKFIVTTPFLLSKLFMPFLKRIQINYEHMIRHITYKERNFILIGTGCTGNCSYCIIKKVKGHIRSRRIEEILENIRHVDYCTKNIFLVAEDCGSYGVDMQTNFPELLVRIHQRYPQATLDINNINPYWLETQPEDYIKLFTQTRIDFALIPLQSGSKKIIIQMNRRYDPKKVLPVIDQIKNISPTSFLYTHFIVGFPGESTVDFLKTVAAVKHFDYSIPFKYSPNMETPSASLPHQKSNIVKSLRYIVLMFVINIVIFTKLLKRPFSHQEKVVGQVGIELANSAL